MADIFISYSKSDREVTEALARDLEAAGYSVWWDTSLVPGDVFKDVILEKIAGARAAIVIWTKGSVKSEWVYSEATRAKAQGKLVPLRTADIAPHDVPPPFDATHTELVTSRTALIAGLAKHGVKPVVKAEPAAGSAPESRVMDNLSWPDAAFILAHSMASGSKTPATPSKLISRRSDCPSPLGRRWRGAPDGGRARCDLSASRRYHQLFAPHPPFGHLFPIGEGD